MIQVTFQPLGSWSPLLPTTPSPTPATTLLAPPVFVMTSIAPQMLTSGLALWPPPPDFQLIPSRAPTPTHRVHPSIIPTLPHCPLWPPGLALHLTQSVSMAQAQPPCLTPPLLPSPGKPPTWWLLYSLILIGTSGSTSQPVAGEKHNSGWLVLISWRQSSSGLSALPGSPASSSWWITFLFFATPLTFSLQTPPSSTSGLLTPQ